jgi:hypothetical protein
MRDGGESVSIAAFAAALSVELRLLNFFKEIGIENR